MKNRMWAGLKKFYGREKAKLIMPESYDLSKEKCSSPTTIQNKNENEKCDLEILEEKLNENKEKNSNSNSKSPLVFILKNPILHSQKGYFLFSLCIFFLISSVKLLFKIFIISTILIFHCPFFLFLFVYFLILILVFSIDSKGNCS